MKPTNRQLTIDGLRRCGWTIDESVRSKKYMIFSKQGDCRTFFVGKAGALRVSRTGIASDSVSMTGRKLHCAFRAVGDLVLNLTIEQATAIVEGRTQRNPLLSNS